MANGTHPANFISEGIKRQRRPHDPGMPVQAYLRGRQLGEQRRAKRKKQVADALDIDLSDLGVMFPRLSEHGKQLALGHVEQYFKDVETYGDQEALTKAELRKPQVLDEFNKLKFTNEQGKQMVEDYREGLWIENAPEMLKALNSSGPLADLAKFNSEYGTLNVNPQGHFTVAGVQPYDPSAVFKDLGKDPVSVGTPTATPIPGIKGKTQYHVKYDYDWKPEDKETAAREIATDPAFKRWAATGLRKKIEEGQYAVDSPKIGEPELQRFVMEQMVEPVSQTSKFETRTLQQWRAEQGDDAKVPEIYPISQEDGEITTQSATVRRDPETGQLDPDDPTQEYVYERDPVTGEVVVDDVTKEPVKATDDEGYPITQPVKEIRKLNSAGEGIGFKKPLKVTVAPGHVWDMEGGTSVPIMGHIEYNVDEVMPRYYEIVDGKPIPLTPEGVEKVRKAGKGSMRSTKVGLWAAGMPTAGTLRGKKVRMPSAFLIDNKIASELPPQFLYKWTGRLPAGMIRVRDKTTGKTGIMPSANFDSTRFEKL